MVQPAASDARGNDCERIPRYRSARRRRGEEVERVAAKEMGYYPENSVRGAHEGIRSEGVNSATTLYFMQPCEVVGSAPPVLWAA